MPDFQDTSFRVHRVGGHTASFVVYREETTSTTSYYQYVSSEGFWYIMKRVISGGIATSSFYRKRNTGETGETSVDTSWTDRASLAYQRFDLEFGASL